MTSRQTVGSEAALIPPFLGKQGCNITFVLDCSESTRTVLESVKRLLIQTLLTKASLRDSLFNIITFSSKVNCLSHHMLCCAPDTVYSTLSWIHSISCSPGRDLLAALSLSLTDPACDAVHLLCKDLPEQPEAVLRALPALAAGRPVNVFCLQDTGSQLDRKAQDYLQCLSQATRGSFYLILVGLSGVLEKVIPLYVADTQSLAPPVSLVKHCCPSASVIIPPCTSSPLLRCSLGNPFRPATSYLLSGQNLEAPQFFPGCRVLARREVDGLYYQGTVIQQVQGRRGVWVVEFDHPGSASLGLISSQRQLVCSLDMVNDNRAHTNCCLVPGDVVLSPWEPDLRRYGPGRLMAAMEHRGADGVTSLRVLMWNSSVSLVPNTLVLPISSSHHDRIVRELQIPTRAPGQCCSWLCTRSSSCTPQLFFPDCCHSVPNHWSQSCLASRGCGSSFGRRDGFDKKEQERQVDLRNVMRSDSEVPFSSSSSLADDKTGSSVSPSLRLRSKNQRPPWRYWRRMGPEPQHRQPGSAAPRMTSQPLVFSIPVPPVSASPNLSSLFLPLPGTKGRRENMRDVFGKTNFKPRPPADCKA